MIYSSNAKKRRIVWPTRLALEVNSVSVRQFTPEELPEAGLAANLILQTGFLPGQISQEVQNVVRVIDAEFRRREEEAKKKDEEERKKKCEALKRTDCVQPGF